MPGKEGQKDTGHDEQLFCLKLPRLSLPCHLGHDDDDDDDGDDDELDDDDD